MSKLLSVIICAGLLAGSVCFAQEAAPTAKAASTLDNLQAAFNGESNAKARYEAFAVKADEEGYKGVAGLFRAAAKSEGVHLQKHATVIKKLGAEPKAEIQKPDVKSTKENLEAALKGESYERDTMYTEFIKQAELDKNTDAARSFKGAVAAEAEHAKLYKQALDNMDAWKAEKTFLVCTVCGYTTMDLTLKQCPVCSAPRKKFDEVK